MPFSIYLGWITVATIANITNLLWSAGWNGFGLSAQAWFLVMLAAAIIIAAAMALTRHDVAYLLVLVWAVVGIAVKTGWRAGRRHSGLDGRGGARRSGCGCDRRQTAAARGERVGS